MKRFDPAIGRRAVLGGLAGGLAAPAIVSAQRHLSQPAVRYINPYPAGGPTDTLSRLFCAKMTELTGQQWIVENRGGAGGNVGMDVLAKSDPDGYSLGLGGIAVHAIAPASTPSCRSIRAPISPSCRRCGGCPICWRQS